MQRKNKNKRSESSPPSSKSSRRERNSSIGYILAFGIVSILIAAAALYAVFFFDYEEQEVPIGKLHRPHKSDQKGSASMKQKRDFQEDAKVKTPPLTEPDDVADKIRRSTDGQHAGPEPHNSFVQEPVVNINDRHTEESHQGTQSTATYGDMKSHNQTEERKQPKMAAENVKQERDTTAELHDPSVGHGSSEPTMTESTQKFDQSSNNGQDKNNQSHVSEKSKKFDVQNEQQQNQEQASPAKQSMGERKRTEQIPAAHETTRTIRKQSTEGTKTTEKSTEGTKTTEKSTEGTKITEKSTKGTKTTEKSTEGAKTTEQSIGETKVAEESTEGAKTTKQPTEGSKTTEQSTEDTKVAEQSTEGAKTTEQSTNETKLAKESTERAKTTEKSTEEAKTTEKSTEEAKTTEKSTEGAKTTEKFTEGAKIAEKSTEGAKTTEQPTEGAKDPEREKLLELSQRNLTCDQWMESARKLMMQGEIYYAAALDMLKVCVYQDASHAQAFWNIAVLLVKMDRKQEAVAEMGNAISLEPENIGFLQGYGSLLFNLAQYENASQAFESYLQAQLGLSNWPNLMESVYYLREDELSFITQEETLVDVLAAMKKLLKSYLESRQFLKADRLYQILITIQPHEHDLMASYSTFAFSLGNIWNGVKYMKVKMEHDFVHNNLGNMEEAYQVMTAHMLRLATGGFDSHIVSIARSVLLAGKSAVRMIRENCYEGLLAHVGPATLAVSQHELVGVLSTCMDQQRIILSLIQSGATTVANNRFGWTSFLHGALLGDEDVLKAMIKAKMDVQHRNMLGQTALHVAAMRGHYRIVPYLLKNGLKKGEKDEYGRTPVDTACSVGLFPDQFVRALGADLPRQCPVPHYTKGTSVRLADDGGWLKNFRPIPKELETASCDIDSVTSGITAAAFLRDYLSIQKPVIIRRGLSNWSQLKYLFQRSSLDRDFGVLMFARSAVPYAEAFGLPHNTTSLRSYLHYLRDLHDQEQKGTAPEQVDYIFSSVKKDSPLREYFEVPSALNPEVTAISTQTVQFYVGPSHSGAPPHFHNFGWNGLVYGLKRWFLFPPHEAVYSKQSVFEWYKQLKQKDGLQCTQNPGDVMFVPAMWGHAVINLEESVGFASEFIYGASEFSL